MKTDYSIVPNMLDRKFEASAPNQRRAADFTYIWTQEGWLYYAVVLDLFSRRIVGWSISREMAAQLVTDALVMMIWRRGRSKQLLHHSDQGSQYTSEQFQRLLPELGVTCSINRRSDVWYNSAIETFFQASRPSAVDRNAYHTRDEAKADVFDYVERFYNPQRRRSTLRYLSPVKHENATSSA
jgi:putative transposase